MEDENFVYKITSKGDVFGLSLFVPVYQFILNFKTQHPKDESIESLKTLLENKMDNQIRRAKENKDGLMSFEDLEKLKELERFYNHFRTRLNKIYE